MFAPFQPRSLKEEDLPDAIEKLRNDIEKFKKGKHLVIAKKLEEELRKLEASSQLMEKTKYMKFKKEFFYDMNTGQKSSKNIEI